MNKCQTKASPSEAAATSLSSWPSARSLCHCSPGGTLRPPWPSPNNPDKGSRLGKSRASRDVTRPDFKPRQLGLSPRPASGSALFSSQVLTSHPLSPHQGARPYPFYRQGPSSAQRSQGLSQGQSSGRKTTLAACNPSSSPARAKAASFPIINAIKEGREEGGRGGRSPRPPPQPAAGSFLVRGKPLMKAPQMPLSRRCRPGSPAELQGAHLCSQLAHRSSIKAHACCQEQRPEGRPC